MKLYNSICELMLDHHNIRVLSSCCQVGVNGDIPRHVAGPEPVHGVQDGQLAPGAGHLDLEQDKILEHLTAPAQVALHKLNPLHLTKIKVFVCVPT